MLEIDGSSNLDDVMDYLRDYEKYHVPFALSGAMNQTAYEIRDQVKEDLDDEFMLRRPWVKRGIRVDKASKKKMNAAVFTKDWFMKTQETGGARRPTSSDFIKIPTKAARKGDDVRQGLKKKADVLLREAAKPRRRPMKGKRKRKPRAFVMGTEGGRPPLGIYIRSTDERLPIQLLFRLKKKIQIDERWNFENTAGRISAKQLRKNFLNNMEKALSTSKKGPTKSSFIKAKKMQSEMVNPVSGNSVVNNISGGVDLSPPGRF